MSVETSTAVIFEVLMHIFLLSIPTKLFCSHLIRSTLPQRSGEPFSLCFYADSMRIIL